MLSFHGESDTEIPAFRRGAARWPLHLTDVFIVLLYSAQVMLFWSVGKEDAFICYRYARNLARGDGLVYNPGEYVEGISNLLWTLLLALLVRLGIPVDTADNLMVLFFAVAAFLVFRRAFMRVMGDTWEARLPLFLLLCMTALPVGFGNGLEGSATACAAAVLFAGAAAAAPATMAAGAALMLTLRPEGFVYAGWALAWLLTVSWRDPVQRRRAIVWAAAAAGVLAAVTVFRLAYYGDFLPNTVRAKAAPISREIAEGGFNYVKDYLWRVGPVLLLLAAAGGLWRPRRRLWFFAAGMVALSLAVPWRNGGDWMREFRLPAPFYGLLAFMAVLPVCALRNSRWWVRFAAAAVCVLGGLWTVQPGLILRHAPEFRFTVAGMWRQPVKASRLFDPHISLADFQGKDDRVLSEWGGGPGYALDGVPVIEMWGLADRGIATGTGPGTHHVPGGGRICWPAAFAKNPTHLLFWHVALPARISSIAEVPELRGAIARFLAVQDVPFDKDLRMFNLLFTRADRPVMSKSLLHCGAIAPALDYDDPSLYGIPFIISGNTRVADDDDMCVRTLWQKTGWTAEDGGTVPTEWLFWDDDQRLSSRLMLRPGMNRFTRDLIDDTPIAFVFGRFPLFAAHVHARVLVGDGQGGSFEVAAADWSDSPSSEFILTPLAVSDWKTDKPVRVTVELESDTACGVFMAAHRWNHEPFPEVPARFVADTRIDAPPVLQLPEMPDPEAAVKQQQAEFANDPMNPSKRFLLGAALARNGAWAAAEPLLRQVMAFDRSTWLSGAVVYDGEAERRFKSGDLNGAVDLLRMVRALEPENLGHALQMARILRGLGRRDEALDQCREVLTKAPESPLTAMLMDEILGEGGDFQARTAEWRSFAAGHPKSVVAALHFGLALAASGDETAAETQYGHGLALAPKDGGLLLALAELLVRRGEYEQAAVLCRDAVAADKATAGRAARCLGDAALQRADRGELPAALGMLQEASVIDPVNLGLLVSLGGVQEKAGNVSAALDAYRRMLDAEPESPRSAARIDAILAARGDAQARAAEWRGMMERHPKARVPRIHLAAALADAGETGAATGLYRTLLSEVPDDSEAQLGLVGTLAHAGDAVAALGTLRALAPVKAGQEGAAAAALDRIAAVFTAHSEAQAAAEVLRRSAALDAGNFQHAALLAGALEQTGDSDGALAQYRTILSSAPESSQSADRIDAIYSARGDAAGRAAEWRGIAEKHPDAVIPWRRLAEALDGAGDAAGAAQARARAGENAGRSGS